MKSIIPFLIIGLSLTLPFNTEAANRFWVATSSSNWNNAANWSNSSGGTGGAGVPGTNDNVTFNIAGLGNCTVDVPIAIRNFTLAVGYTGTVFQGSNSISISNNASLSGGTFSGGTADITIGGDITLSGTSFTSTKGILELGGNVGFSAGVLVHNNGIVRFSASGGAATISSTSGNLNLNEVEFLALANQTYSIGAGVTITANGNLTFAGTNRIILNSGNINANGNIILTNTSTSGGGTAVINIVGSANVILDGSAVAINQNILPFVNIIKTGGTLTLKGIISVSRSWTFSSGTVDASSFASTVAFGGNNLNITSNGMSFHNLTITSNTISLINQLTINNALGITGGNLSPGANTINIAGNWTDYGTAGFTESTSTVNFNGGTLQTITATGGENFTNLTTNNSGAGIQLNNNTTIATMLTMGQGNINLNGNNLRLGLSVANNGTLSYTNGTMFGSGTFTRWFKTGVIPNGSVTGLFPMGTAANYRPFFVSAPGAGPTNGGTINVGYNDATTNRYIPTYLDGAATIMVRKDLNWVVTTGNGLNGGTYNLDVQGTGFGLIGAVSDLRLTLANSVIGAPGVNAGTTINPQINRTGLTRANLVNTFYIGSINLVNTPLPITLVSFTASVVNKEIVLKWSTSSEVNNDYFTVQKSKDGTDWENLENIPGGGSSSTERSYSTRDVSPYPGISYYRLRQTDIDGKISYSLVTPVKLPELAPEINIFPNPATDLINIKFPAEGKYEIAIINSAGQLMSKPFTLVGSGTTLNISSMKPGIYYFQILHEGRYEIRKVIIRK